ncbi:hypothetical protein [Brevifollis gellanilyticus]|uniref:DUF4412 domain-containing protein n=1 Tax=Brevifollis gellanilyticus TaxID=748831 RepID=A0A512M6R7_9BACT|nr:hypothetical protein [Brevifollis gellanilyticus]GEP42414.1 hypothetical protein BGE01nite_17050 [Brevifollis gellanilyticus]
MVLNSRFHPLFLAAALWLTAMVGAQAQWLIYELTFTPEKDSVNFSSYKSAYLVAPANGGAATMVLTTDDGGRYFAVADSGAKFFLAANATQRKAAFSALAISGNAQALYTASGNLNRSLLLDVAETGGQKVLRVAETLHGRLMAADDESDKGPASDGSIGMIGSAVIKGTLREDLTSIATRHFTSQTLAVSYVVELLEKYGYAPDEGSAPMKLEVETIQEDGSIIDASLFPPEALPKAP